jgi:hypothetical protein
MFQKHSHDFGTVARASKCVVSFPFKNIYKEDIHVSHLEVSCSCTSAEVVKKDLKTYETSEIVATFNTRSFLGQRGATIKVVIDRPYFAEVRLRVDGNIRSDVVFDPPLVEVGNIDAGSPVERRVMVRYAGRRDWTITDVTSANKYYEVSLSKPVREGTDRGHQRRRDAADSALRRGPHHGPADGQPGLALLRHDPPRPDRHEADDRSRERAVQSRGGGMRRSQLQI